MAQKELVVTQSGLKKLEEELQYLKSVKRSEIAERIKVAISYGDLSENSEYEDAKNEQAFIEGRINTIENLLRNVKVVQDSEVGTDVVTVGSKVRVVDLEYGDEEEYEIVGAAESDPAEGRISNESPIGEALLGKHVGDEVVAQVPSGTVRLKVLGIHA
ncbi:MAG: transcription elongation factor GreA [Firmicutes bacterium]|nr:transcription elongation factor GreA [Bacillota bacterium]